MKNRKPTNKQLKNQNLEHHSNLALTTTVLALVSFVLIMIIYVSARNPQTVDFALTFSKVFGVCYFALAALLTYKSIKANSKFLLEYIIYTILIGFGFVYMYSMPMWIFRLIQGTFVGGNWAVTIFRAMCAVTVVYSIASVVWHLVLATPKGKK